MQRVLWTLILGLFGAFHKTLHSNSNASLSQMQSDRPHVVFIHNGLQSRGATSTYNLRKETLVDKAACFLYNVDVAYLEKPPSSRGLGHLPFAEKTGIRLPLGVRLFNVYRVYKKFNSLCLKLLSLLPTITSLLLALLSDLNPMLHRQYITPTL